MKALDVFEALGIPPTDNYGDIKKAYVVKMKKLKKKMANYMNRGETGKIEKVDESLQKLNLAFNEINKNKSALGEVLNTAMAEEAYKNMGIDEEDLMGVEEQQPESLRRAVGIGKKLEVRWEEKQLDTIEEIITFKDFVNGTKILLDNGDVLEVPPYFLGVIFNYKSEKFQFVKVKAKGSVAFIFNSSGNLVLKSIPEGAELSEKGILKFEYATKQFQFDLTKMEEKVKGSYRFIGEGQGIQAYGEKEKGDLYIDVNNLTSKTEGMEEKVKNVLL